MTFDLSLIEVLRMGLSAAELLVIEAEERDLIVRWITARPVRPVYPYSPGGHCARSAVVYRPGGWLVIGEDVGPFT